MDNKIYFIKSEISALGAESVKTKFRNMYLIDSIMYKLQNYKTNLMRTLKTY